MSSPQLGDILIRGTTANGYALVDAITLKPCVTGAFSDLRAAVAVARSRTSGDVWQQSVDHRGRPLGDPLRLSKHAAQHST